MTDYTDARTLSADHERHLCPECGVGRWFKHHDPRYDRAHWTCERCSAWLKRTLEYPCPECDVRMVRDGDAFVCRVRDCHYDEDWIDRDALIDRLSSDAFMVRGMPGVMAGDCPVCGADNGIDGGPDGELECSECHDFYAGRYSGQWFCYAIWLRDADRIRVNA